MESHSQEEVDFLKGPVLCGGMTRRWFWMDNVEYAAYD
jgi:hypothetical protein